MPKARDDRSLRMFGKKDMNPDSADWLETWRLKIIATSVGAELRTQCGANEFYSVVDVQAACDARNVVGPSRACALAMFVEPANLGDTLKEYGISDPAGDFRKMMAQNISCSDSSDLGASTIDFHHMDVGYSHGHDSFSFGDYGGDSGGDSGGE